MKLGHLLPTVSNLSVPLWRPFRYARVGISERLVPVLWNGSMS